MKAVKTELKLAPLAVALTMASGTAHAGLALNVVDNANLLINETIMASNIAANVQLTAIKKTLRNAGEGTTVYNIDKSSKHIDKSTRNIDKSTTQLTEINTKINNNLQFNTEINAEFNWTINKGEDVIIPIPLKLVPHLTKIKNGQDTGEFVSHFRDVEAYEDFPVDADFTANRLEGSRARKAANDALAHLLEMDKDAMDADVENIQRLADVSNKAKGHGRQLQVANAIAGSEVNQLMKLRAMLLVSEEARAAEARVAADRDAQAIVTGNRMRDGLEAIVRRTPSLLPVR